MAKKKIERKVKKVAMDCGLPKYTDHNAEGIQVSLEDLKKLAKVGKKGAKKGAKSGAKGGANDGVEKTDWINWAEDLLGIPDVWQLTQGEGVRVAILDTGIDTDHPDLQAGIVETADFTGSGIEDRNGHGTHCAGIVGARRNGTGFAGVAPSCDLMIGKVLGDDGSGAWSWTTDAIYWAVDNGADIISMSLGGGYSDPDMYEAIQYALFYGTHIFCAAGNSGSLYQNSIDFPGRIGGVLTIASHDSNGNPSGFTSRGGEVDVMAPGSEIWSTWLDGGYRKLSGTSMATPFAAGLGALIASKHMASGSNATPLDNNEDMKQHLLWMASHPGYHENSSGYGPLIPFSYFGG